MQYIKGIKILAIIMIIVMLPSIIIGFGIFTTPALLWFVLQMDKVTSGSYKDSAASAAQRSLMYLSVLLAGVTAGFIVWMLVGLTFVFNSRPAPSPFLYGSVVVVGTLALLWQIRKT